MGFGVWGLGFGVWGLGFGVWGLGFGVWGLGFGVWGLGSSFNPGRFSSDLGFGCRGAWDFSKDFALNPSEPQNHRDLTRTLM